MLFRALPLMPILLSATALTASAPPPSANVAAPLTAARCSAILGTTSAGLTVRTARFLAAGPLATGMPGPNGAAAPSIRAPDHCLIEGAIEPRTGADGKPYSINVQLRVPADWNGRLMYQGGGGLNGFVGVAYGANSSQASTSPAALARGFAVVTTDSGHAMGPNGTGMADFARDQEARLNYAYQAIGKVTVAAKATLLQLSGALPNRTYFVGCSNGGREALTAAQRYPSMFDGVAAGDPAFNLSRAALLAHYSTRQLRAAKVTATDLRQVGRGAVRKCDGLDGRLDGMIFDAQRCGFTVRQLECRATGTNGCLPLAKVEAIDRAFRGPLDRAGRPLFASWSYDSGVGQPGWMTWQTGSLTGLSEEALARYFSMPPMTPEELDKIDYANAYSRLADVAAITDATSTDLSTFRARGGKLLLTTGWSDPIFAPNDLVRWYEKLGADMRATDAGDAATFARMFLVPGMLHCGGGDALDDFDALDTLVNWVEKAQAPLSIPARGKAFPGQSRPLCAFPAHAVYRRGEGREASDYVCS